MIKKRTKLARISPVLVEEIKLVCEKNGGISFVEASQNVGKILMSMRVRKVKIKTEIKF